MRIIIINIFLMKYKNRENRDCKTRVSTENTPMENRQELGPYCDLGEKRCVVKSREIRPVHGSMNENKDLFKL